MTDDGTVSQEELASMITNAEEAGLLPRGAWEASHRTLMNRRSPALNKDEEPMGEALAERMCALKNINARYVNKKDAEGVTVFEGFLKFKVSWSDDRLPGEQGFHVMDSDVKDMGL